MKEIEKITSRDNRRLVHARKVRDGKVPEQIFIEGRRLIDEALSSDVDIVECLVADCFRNREMLDAIAKRTSAIVEIPDKIFGSIADTNQPQGIILIAKRPKFSSGSIESRLGSAALPIVIFLKEIRNPSNLGAVLRAAEAAGVVGVIVSTNSADVYSPKALRAAMGSSFRLPIWEEADFDEILRWAQTAKLTTTAAAAAAADNNYTDIDWKTPRLLVFGSEAHGLSRPELERIDEEVTIPMEDGVESLNLAVSAGIILFEAKRQNG